MIKAVGFIIMLTYGSSAPVPLPTPYNSTLANNDRTVIYSLEDCKARIEAINGFTGPVGHCVAVAWEESK